MSVLWTFFRQYKAMTIDQMEISECNEVDDLSVGYSLRFKHAPISIRHYALNKFSIIKKSNVLR